MKNLTFRILTILCLILGFTSQVWAEDEWVLTQLSNLSSKDVFVIVDQTSATALTNDKGTSAAPAAATITLSEDKNSISGVSDNMKWNISGNETDGYTFYPNGVTSKWLYTTNVNNGLRVGTNADNKTFQLSSNWLQNNGNSRYVGVYSNQDWRCYTDNNGNIQTTRTAFYKLKTGESGDNSGSGDGGSNGDSGESGDSGNTDAKTITINASKIAEFKGVYAQYDWADGDFSGKLWAYRAGSSEPYAMQFNNTPYVYNTTPVPGRIKTIQINAIEGATARTWSVYMAGTPLTSTTGATQIGTQQSISSSYTWEVPSNDNYSYFYITKGSNSTQISSFVITYEAIQGPKTETSLTWKKDGATFTSTEQVLIDETSHDYPTLVATPEELSGITYSSSNTAVATINNSGEITLVAKGTTTIKADFAGDDTYAPSSAQYNLEVVPNYHKVYFSVNGTKIDEKGTQVEVGEAITFPTTNLEVQDVVFMGWTNTPLSGTQEAAPSFVNARTQKMGDEDVTYYAVYATAYEGSDFVYTLTDELQEELTYVFVSSNKTGDAYALNGAGLGTASNTNENSAKAVTIETDNNEKVIKTIDSDIEFIFRGGNKYDIVSSTSDPIEKLLINGNGIGKSATNFKAFWNTNKGLYGTNTNGNKQYYVAIEGTKFKALEDAEQRVYAYEKSSTTIYSDYCTLVNPKALTKITISGTPEEFWKGDQFNANGITVTATWEDNATREVTDECGFTGFDMNVSGSQTITVSFRDKTTTYTINVKTIANTPETAYSVEEAIALVDAGKDLGTEVYVTGFVSSIYSKDLNEEYGTLNFFISSNGTTENPQFELYRNTPSENGKWASIDDLSIDDEVIGYGKLTKFNKTYEFAEGNYLVSQKHPNVSSITVDGTLTITEYTIGDNIDCSGLTAYAIIDGVEQNITSKARWEATPSTFSQSGVIDVTICAIFAGKTSEGKICQIQVNKKSPSISIADIADLEVGKVVSIAATTTPEDAGLSYSIVSGSEYITISEGAITGIKPGTAEVKASYSGNEEYAAADITFRVTVTAEDTRFIASQEGFSSIKGDLDNYISFEAFKGNAATSPGIYGGNCIRLYQASNNTVAYGGYITISGKYENIVISEVTFTTGNTYDRTYISYTLDDNTELTSKQAVAAESDFCVKDIECNKISFYCMTNSGKERADIHAITVKYSINVDHEEVVELVLSGDYPTKFKSTDTFSHDGMTITACLNTGFTRDVTDEAEFSAPDFTQFGEQTVTVSYEGVETTYSINVINAGLFLYESFDTNNGTGGNDDKWSGQIASSNTSSDNEGWTFEKCNGADKCIRIGDSSNAGSATTPGIDYEGFITISYKAALWSNDTNKKIIISKVNGDSKDTISERYLTPGVWSNFEEYVYITKGTKIKFATSKTSSNRFFLDEVKISGLNSRTLQSSANLQGWKTFYDKDNSYEVDDNTTIYTVSETSATSIIVHPEEGAKIIPAGCPVLLNTSASDYKIELTPTTETGIAFDNNMLKTADTKGNRKTAYILAYTKARGLAFYHFTGIFEIGDVYIDIAETPTSSAALRIVIDEEATGINDFEQEKETAETLYDLSGLKVKVTKGIVIKNNKAILVK